MEKKILRLLIVDDSPDDAETVFSAVRKAGYLLKSQRVQDLAGFQAELERAEWDAVVSELMVPHFGAALALDQLKHASADLPFLVFTRQISDADLLKIMRAGAHDVILKKEPVRLVPALERELKVAAERARYREATKSLAEVENKHRAIVEGSREAVCYCQDGMHVDANKAYLEIFGYDSLADLEGIPVMNLIDKTDQPRFKDFIRKNANGVPQEFKGVRKEGERFPAEIAVSAITINDEACTQIVVTDISKRKAVETKLQYLNQHDPLTGLYNRTHLVAELGKAIERAKQSNVVGSLIYLDFHKIKQMTSQLGHAAGDRLLLKAARSLRETLGDQVLVARIGDHEFAAFLADGGDARLKETTGAVQKSLGGFSCVEGGQTFKCEFHLTSALVDKSAESAQKLLASLYRAVAPTPKTEEPAAPAPASAAAPAPTPDAGAKPAAAPAAKTVTLTPAAPAPQETPEPARPAVAAAPVPVTPGGGIPADWQERIATALAKDEFQLNYQPIINLHGDPAEYFEVLVRMRGRNDEVINAAQFMPQAEQTGQSAAIDRWVVRQSIRALAELHREQREATFFINLAPTVFADVELLPLVQQQLKETGMRSAHLVLEIDESALTANPGPAANFVRTAKRLGCHLCVDNFGRTLSALNHLRDLPVDYLKIDGALVRNVRDPAGQAALKAVVEVAKTLDKKTIAKSVESAEVLSGLWTFGIDYVQGNYFQQAENTTQYEFEGETTLSSEHSVPQWASGTQKRR